MGTRPCLRPCKVKVSYGDEHACAHSHGHGQGEAIAEVEDSASPSALATDFDYAYDRLSTSAANVHTTDGRG